MNKSIISAILSLFIIFSLFVFPSCGNDTTALAPEEVIISDLKYDSDTKTISAVITSGSTIYTGYSLAPRIEKKDENGEWYYIGDGFMDFTTLETIKKNTPTELSRNISNDDIIDKLTVGEYRLIFIYKTKKTGDEELSKMVYFSIGFIQHDSIDDTATTDNANAE
jgi:hypothetical protein